MPAYTFIRPERCTVIADTAEAARALALDPATTWIPGDNLLIEAYEDTHGRTMAALPFGPYTVEECDEWGDRYLDYEDTTEDQVAYHRAIESAYLREQERDAVWVGDAA